MSGTITHSWNGTILTVTSDSGTSSADLKGAKGDTGIRGAQGAAGYIDESKVYTKTNPPTAAEVGARDASWMPSAEDVGARANDWMPTAEEVGARNANWLPTAAEIGAKDANWMPTAAEVGARAFDWLPSIVEIGAAPSGYGLGGSAVSINSLDNAKEFGLYISNNGAPSDAEWTCLAMPNASGNVAQIASRCLAEQVFYATRAFVSGSWGEWELVNPYMAVGTEYRTTEKFKGKPVYKKLVEYTNTSAIGTNGTVTSIKIPHGISNFGELVSVTAKQGGKALPYLTTGGYLAVVSTVSEVNIIIDTNASWTSRTWQFEIAYTKAV